MNNLVKNAVIATALILTITGCCRHSFETLDPVDPVVGSPILPDEAIIRARTEFSIKSPDMAVSVFKKIINLFMPTAYAYNGVVAPNSIITVTYNLAATNVNFGLATGNSAFANADIITIGDFDLSSLDDNNLKLCPASGESGTGNQKCSTAAIRVKLTDALGNPVGGIQSPDSEGDTPVTVTNNTGVDTVVGSTFTILNTRSLSGINRLRNTHFVTSGPYTIKMNTANAGTGSYSVKVVVEYVLFK